MPQPITLRAACHCGALEVSLRLREGREPEQLPVRACQCGYCRPRRARWTSDPGGAVELAAREPAAISRYRFGTRTADFLVCSSCGALAAAVCMIAGREYAVVNVDLLLVTNGLTPAPERAGVFDGEPVAARLSRRARTWTPVVRGLDDHAAE